MTIKKIKKKFDNKTYADRETIKYNNFFSSYKERVVTHLMSNVKITTPGKKDSDYGNHNLTLNFPSQTIANTTTSTDSTTKTSGIDRYKLWIDGKTHIPSSNKLVIGLSSLVKDLIHLK